MPQKYLIPGPWGSGPRPRSWPSSSRRLTRTGECGPITARHLVTCYNKHLWLVRSGAIEFPEFAQLCAKFLVEDPDPETMRAELKQAFRLFDKQGTVSRLIQEKKGLDWSRSYPAASCNLITQQFLNEIYTCLDNSQVTDSRHRSASLVYHLFGQTRNWPSWNPMLMSLCLNNEVKTKFMTGWHNDTFKRLNWMLPSEFLE